MKASMKAYITVQMFKTAFCVEEADNNSVRLASNMALSASCGYRGFRAVGKTRKSGASVYTLESIFAVCKLMGPSFFAGGIMPSPARHLLPRKEVKFKEFLALLFLNGNKVGDLDTSGKDYKILHNAARVARLYAGRRKGVYDYAALAEEAKKCGWSATPLQGELDVSPEQPVLRLDDMEAGEEPLPADTKQEPTLLAAVLDCRRILQELLEAWKGEKQ